MASDKSKDYDYIFSLGGNCTVAAQLRRRNLRAFSTPLDWVSMEDERSLRYLPTGFRTKFADFALKENMQIVTDRPTDGREAGWSRFCYVDAFTGYKFIHHFDDAVECEGVYEMFQADVKRRFDRLFAAVDASASVLFMLETGFPWNPSLADDIYMALTDLWPEKRIALRVMQMSAAEDEEDPARWGGGGLYRYKRRHHMYDYAATSWEWAFLDAFEKKHHPRKPRGLARLVYKLSKSLRNHLVRRGYEVTYG